MKHRLFLISGLSVVLFVIGGQYGANAYFQARQLAAQAELMTVRTRLMKQQVGQLEQKMRVIQRVNGFVNRAGDLQLTPQAWAQYDVNVQDALTFKELAQIIEQCVHNKDLYYKPFSLRVAVGQARDGASGQEAKPTPEDADAANRQPPDLSLSLKGAFFVRH